MARPREKRLLVKIISNFSSRAIRTSITIAERLSWENFLECVVRVGKGRRGKSGGPWRSADQEFNTLYGTDVNDIDSWHKLRLALDISAPQGLQACREVRFRAVFVILHLKKARKSAAFTSTWWTLWSPRKPESRSGSSVSSNSYVIAGGVLRFLLREILHKHVTGGGRQRKWNDRAAR